MMKPGAAIAIAMLLAVIACGDDDGSPVEQTPGATRSESPTLTAAATTPSTPAPTLPPDDFLGDLINGCLPEAVVDITRVTLDVTDCVSDLGGFNPGIAGIAAGPLGQSGNVFFVELSSAIPCQGSTFIAWHDSAWHVQSLEPFLEDSVLVGSSNIPSTQPARTATEKGITYVALPYTVGSCGSGPQQHIVLLALHTGNWTLAWASKDDARADLGHTTIEFIGDGIDVLMFEGDSWMRPGEISQIFHESNPGPHRYFEQTWEREGETYVLESETQLPTPYARLVNFVYGISHQANSATQDMVTDPDLIQKAIDLGLVQDPIGQEWIGYCGDGAPLADPPCRVEVPNGPVVLIDMVQVDGHWLISSVEAQ